jgi:acyl-phosphate glycerol 3-phosphate acyltransferase
MASQLPLLLLAGAYLVGAIPFGYLVALARGVNILEKGSGNIGATNVGRVLGRKFGVLVFLLDCAKGAGPVATALAMKSRLPESLWTQGGLEVGAGLAAFLGHLYPVYLRFRGGKGVATGAGVVAVLFPIPALAAVATWLVVVSGSRYVSLASLAAVAVLCLVHVSLAGPALDNPRTLFCLFAGGLVAVKHRSNIVRLWRGTENRLEESFAMEQLLRSLHVLALGTWFGMAVFFTFVVALSLFNTFETLGKAPAEQRPDWLPLPAAFAKSDAVIDGPKEQGSRIAGYAVGPIFPWYFLLQGVCGLVALGTALPWSRLGRVHRWRTLVLFAGVALVLAGWPVERRVTELRTPRNQTTDAYLQASPSEAAAAQSAMREARGTFGMWHTVSLFLNLGAIVCAGSALAMAGSMPGPNGPETRRPE